MAVCGKEATTAARENTKEHLKTFGLGMLITALTSSCISYKPASPSDSSSLTMWIQTLSKRHEEEQKHFIVRGQFSPFHGPYVAENAIIFLDPLEHIDLFPSREPFFSPNPSAATSTAQDPKFFSTTPYALQSNGVHTPITPEIDSYAWYGLERKLLPQKPWEKPPSIITFDEQPSPLLPREKRSAAFLEDYETRRTAVKIIGRSLKDWIWDRREFTPVSVARHVESEARETLDFLNPLSILPINGNSSVDPYFHPHGDSGDIGVRFKKGPVSLTIRLDSEGEISCGIYVSR